MKKKLIEKLSIIGVVAICAGVSIGQVVSSKISYDQYRNELEEAENNNKVQLSALKAGEVFKIGEHDFIVLEQFAGTTSVISKNLMAENVTFDANTRNYENSSVKKYIENNIQPIIEAEVGEENIVTSTVDLISVDMQHEFSNKCECAVRPLTFGEAREYNNLLVNEKLNDWWWTCTPWSTHSSG